MKLELEKQGETFKPGLPYNVLVVLKHMDDTPIKASIPRRVQVTTYYNYPFATVPSSVLSGNGNGTTAASLQPREDKEVKIVDLDAHGTAMIRLMVREDGTGL